MSRRFFDPQPFQAGQPIALGTGASQHIGRVLRMAPGDAVTLFNGSGGEWTAVIKAVDKKSVTVTPTVFIDRDRVPPLPVVLGLSLIKGERMDYAIQKATELGVAEIHLLETSRTEVRLKGDRESKKREHWHQVIVSACEQCGLNRPPRLAGIDTLAAFIDQASGLRLVAHPGEAPLGATALRGTERITLLTGPEGGFAPDELDAALTAGFQPFALGERVLRAETAPVALLAALWTLLDQ
ncbi:16S rRNA (uracil(1498)-N(3))-methyltransferase [Alcanivorax sp. N3-2A]|nr:16S rRNA (uracil(1498)-N(3))-methyltransferase [Alcanivorax sp. N3-2A]